MLSLVLLRLFRLLPVFLLAAAAGVAVAVGARLFLVALVVLEDPVENMMKYNFVKLKYEILNVPLSLVLLHHGDERRLFFEPRPHLFPH